MTTTTMTIRLDAQTKERLGKLAQSAHRSKSFLAAQAIKEYIELNEWQIQEIHTAITEADNGEFASEVEVSAITQKWVANEN